MPLAWPTPGIAGGKNAEDLGIGQRRHLAVYIGHDRLGLQRSGGAIGVGPELTEIYSVPAAARLREHAVAGDCIVIADTGLVLQDRVDLPHHSVGALKRSGGRELTFIKK